MQIPGACMTINEWFCPVRIIEYEMLVQVVKLRGLLTGTKDDHGN